MEAPSLHIPNETEWKSVTIAGVRPEIRTGHLRACLERGHYTNLLDKTTVGRGDGMETKEVEEGYK
jgi:hypothetical protein